MSDKFHYANFEMCLINVIHYLVTLSERILLWSVAVSQSVPIRGTIGSKPIRGCQPDNDRCVSDGNYKQRYRCVCGPARVALPDIFRKLMCRKRVRSLEKICNNFLKQKHFSFVNIYLRTTLY